MLNFENLDKANFLGVGKYDTPIIQPEHIDVRHLEWIPFNFAKTCTDCATKGVHFFVDDYQFQRVWNQPDKYIPLLRKFGAVCAPDFSMYTDMPLAMQIYNHYRKHWLAAYWQQCGFTLCQPYVGAMNKATSGALMESRNIRLWQFQAWERRKASRIKCCLKKAFGRHWQSLNPVKFCGMANARKNLTGTSRGFSHIISK